MQDAEKLLNLSKYTCMPIIATDKSCFGILSGIDIIQFLDSGQDPKKTKAWEICSHEVFTIQQDETVRAAGSIMVEHKVHNIVVYDGIELKGLITSLNIIENLL